MVASRPSFSNARLANDRFVGSLKSARPARSRSVEPMLALRPACRWVADMRGHCPAASACLGGHDRLALRPCSSAGRGDDRDTAGALHLARDDGRAHEAMRRDRGKSTEQADDTGNVVLSLQHRWKGLNTKAITKPNTEPPINIRQRTAQGIIGESRFRTASSSPDTHFAGRALR